MGRAYDIIKTEQDLSYLCWDEHAVPSGLVGARPKAREGTGPHAVYYKGQHGGELGSHGKDCFAELICSRLMAILGVEGVPIQLLRVKAKEGASPWVLRSKSYRRPGERGLPLSTFFELQGDFDETPYDLCCRMGWERQIAGMILVDYLTATRSRDASCFEVLCDRTGAFRLAPCMPRGFSLTNAFPGQTWRLFPTADVNTDNYLGSKSLEKNLSLVPEDFDIPRLTTGVRSELLAGLNDIEPEPLFLEASWKIIQGRWKHLESLRDI